MRGNRFTIYDALEKAGYFDKNSANTYSRDPTTGESLFTAPHEYPKMLYHPEGEEKVIVPAEIIMTPLGPKSIGEQREMIYKIVGSRVEEEALLADGWHTHPAGGVRKRVELFIEASPAISEKEKAKLLGGIPSISSDTRIRELERELARLTAAGAGEEPAAVQPNPGPLQPVAKAAAMGAKLTPATSTPASPAS